MARLLLAFACLLLTATCSAQRTTLSGALVAGGEVGAFLVTPDGTRVIYEADQLIDGQERIFSASLSGGAPVELSTSFANLAYVTDISADSARVCFSLDNDLSIASADGISTISLTGGRIRCQFSPDSANVAFTNSSSGIQIAPTQTGTPITSLTPGKTSGTAIGFRFNPDNLGIVYAGDYDTSGVIELYRVTISTKEILKVSGNLVSGGDVTQFSNLYNSQGVSPKITVNSARVVFRADAEADNRFELYSSRLSDGFRSKISQGSSPNGDVLEFWISGNTVVYLANLRVSAFEIFSVNLDGSAHTLLSGSSSGSVSDGIEIDPSATYAVYRGDLETAGVRAVYRNAIGNATRVRLSVASAVSILYFLISPDGTRVLYGNDDMAWTVPIGGSAADSVQIWVTGTDVGRRWVWTPDSQKLVATWNGRIYVASPFGLNVMDVTGSVVAGGAVQVSTGFTGQYLPMPAGNDRVVFLGDLVTDNVQELYSSVLPAVPTTTSTTTSTNPTTAPALSSLLGPSLALLILALFASLLY